MAVYNEHELIAAIEAEMQATLSEWRRWQTDYEPDTSVVADALEPLYGMMRYHLGWDSVTFQPSASDGGKKLRGQLCLLGCDFVGGDPATALPLAAAVELLHNFTLVHDDIQDRSELRRHRPTVWSVWGIGQGINVGDGLNALARLALGRLTHRGVSPETTLELAMLSERTLLRILEGQYLDLRFEADWTATPATYTQMIRGKTASLVGFCLEAGARVGGATLDDAANLRQCGLAIGMGFQVRDDILGIWGAEEETGKPPAADIRARKISLPILLALEAASAADKGHVHQVYAAEVPDAAAIASVLAILDRADAKAKAQTVVERYHHEALAALDATSGRNASANVIRNLIGRLATRSF